MEHTPHFLYSFGQAWPLVSRSLVVSVELSVDEGSKVGAEATIVVLTSNVANRAARGVVN